MRRLLAILLLILGIVSPALAHEATDPVCGMVVSTDDAPFPADFRGKGYFFCTEQCRRDFVAQPAKYVASLTVARLSGDARLTLAIEPSLPVTGGVVRWTLTGVTDGERWAVLGHVLEGGSVNEAGTCPSAEGGGGT